MNNRHIFAHAVSPSSPYKNVLSFHRGPEKFEEGKKDKPTWQLWLVPDASIHGVWRHPDTETIEVGWHHFLVRWDHQKPVLELLLDGQAIIHTEDYLKYWPHRVLTSMTVGCWPNPWREHYIDTWIADVGIVANPFDSRHIENALKRRRDLAAPNVAET